MFTVHSFDFDDFFHMDYLFLSADFGSAGFFVEQLFTWISYFVFFFSRKGLKKRSRSALVTTKTELRLIAAAPNIGFSFQPRRV